MNIQEAIKESMRTQKLIKRKSGVTSTMIMPTNTYELMVIWSGNKNRLPARCWQPSADDLIANDWYVTDVDYKELISSK